MLKQREKSFYLLSVCQGSDLSQLPPFENYPPRENWTGRVDSWSYSHAIALCQTAWDLIKQWAVVFHQSSFRFILLWLSSSYLVTTVSAVCLQLKGSAILRWAPALLLLPGQSIAQHHLSAFPLSSFPTLCLFPSCFDPPFLSIRSWWPMHLHGHF